MSKLSLGLVGYGVVGSGVVQLLSERKNFFKKKFGIEFEIKKVCDRSIYKKKTPGLRKAILTKNYKDIVEDKDIDVVVELVGGLDPATDIILESLRNGKHVVTANKEVLAQKGKILFNEARRHNREILFEASVGAGIPIIKSINEGLAGNRFQELYGIINGTSNFILSEMQRSECTFEHALKEAQRRGFAESNPTLDISGMDSAHKLAILIFLALGKFIKVSDIYVEGIEKITHADIEYAQSMNQVIKLLAIAKIEKKALEIRVHPTLIPRRHPLASVNGVFNAISLNTDPVGDILLYGQGAGQMPAASAVVSDLINLAIRSKEEFKTRIGILSREASKIKLRKMDQIETKFYIRFIVIDKPGVLGKIAGVLGRYGISIATVSQRTSSRAARVPVVMITHNVKERMMRLALKRISRMSITKDDPVAIRMERI